ncbi:pyridoxamine 5'-phosphate oxidase family protein [Halobellus marinus]|uniref:pyridoxamine 5'-phosphate oxidase family protein n=1 Tax=Halobellus TaxID=1073986 RepID=UPI0028AF71F9|nr:pyridoxamine 5'-phosphate oxidase family protein [Halobellus sp. DFY28]
MDEYGVGMGDEEIGAFLERQGHGVLSFAGEEPYGLPVSFGYDVPGNRCIFQLVMGDESRKQSRLDDSDSVSLAVYDWQDVDDWQSVVVTGRLTPVEDRPSEITEAVEIFSEYATVTTLTVFQDVKETTPVWYELTITEMTGRQSPRNRAE